MSGGRSRGLRRARAGRGSRLARRRPARRSSTTSEVAPHAWRRCSTRARRHPAPTTSAIRHPRRPSNRRVRPRGWLHRDGDAGGHAVRAHRRRGARLRRRRLGKRRARRTVRRPRSSEAAAPTPCRRSMQIPTRSGPRGELGVTYRACRPTRLTVTVRRGGSLIAGRSRRVAARAAAIAIHGIRAGARACHGRLGSARAVVRWARIRDPKP